MGVFVMNIPSGVVPRVIPSLMSEADFLFWGIPSVCVYLDKLGFNVGFGYTFHYKTNAPLNRHSEALPKNLTPREGAVEQSRC